MNQPGPRSAARPAQDRAPRPRGPLRAVTVDAFGTLVEADGHAEALVDLVASWGLQRNRDEILGAFRTEVAYYRPRSFTGRDEASLRRLRLAATGVFLEALGAADAIRPEDAMPAFVSTLRFRVIDGALPAIDRLSAAGLRLAICANWDIGLHGHLERLGVADRFDQILTSADVGAEKPDPRIFRVALERLGGVRPGEAVHVGNEDVDRIGALAAGMAFEPVPLATLPERLGL
jgi:putative hydrolase of the HAD superfamily